MHSPSKVLAAAAVVAALTACPCGQPADITTRQVAQVPTAVLRAAYTPADYGAYFAADVQVDTGDACEELVASATADVGGVPLDSQQDGDAATCACRGTRFIVSDAAIPATPEATITVADGSGEMTATAPQLFVERTVSVRGAPSQLRAGTRVYLDVLPAGEGVDELTARFRTYSQAAGYQTVFDYRLSAATIAHDANGWYLDVPSVAVAASGQLLLSARTTVATSSCAGAPACEISASTTGWLDTTVTP